MKLPKKGDTLYCMHCHSEFGTAAIDFIEGEIIYSEHFKFKNPELNNSYQVICGNCDAQPFTNVYIEFGASCSHTFETYIGIYDKFQFCTKCDEKVRD